MWVGYCVLMAYGFESGSQLTVLFRLSLHHTGKDTMPGCPAGAFGSGLYILSETPGLRIKPRTSVA